MVHMKRIMYVKKEVWLGVGVVVHAFNPSI